MLPISSKLRWFGYNSILLSLFTWTGLFLHRPHTSMLIMYDVIQLIYPVTLSMSLGWASSHGGGNIMGRMKVPYCMSQAGQQHIRAWYQDNMGRLMKAAIVTFLLLSHAHNIYNEKYIFKKFNRFTHFQSTLAWKKWFLCSMYINMYRCVPW